MDQLSVSSSSLPRSRVARRAAVVQVPLNLVFFGPPGAGKGTQADRFAARHHIPKISTGDMLRKAMQDGTRVGELVRDTLQRGALVGDDLIISIVAARLERPTRRTVLCSTVFRARFRRRRRSTRCSPIAAA